MSVALYARDESEFCWASALISWLWKCKQDEYLENRASFHVFFPSSSASAVAQKNAEGLRLFEVDCESAEEYFRKDSSAEFSYRVSQKNVGRGCLLYSNDLGCLLHYHPSKERWKGGGGDDPHDLGVAT